METLEWLDKTETKQSVSLDVGFIIVPTFYIGNENSNVQLQDPNFRVRLYTPKINLLGDYALTKEVEKNLPEIKLYYRDVLKHIEDYKKAVAINRSYFWLRPLIFKIDDFAITFPWYDTVLESERFLTSVSNAIDEELFWDADQGWEIRVFGKDNKLYFWVRNPDDDEDYYLLNFDRQDFVAQATESQRRMKSIIDELTQEFGEDFWTKH